MVVARVLGIESVRRNSSQACEVRHWVGMKNPAVGRGSTARVVPDQFTVGDKVVTVPPAGVAARARITDERSETRRNSIRAEATNLPVRPVTNGALGMLGRI